MKSLPFARLVMYASVAYKFVVLSRYLVEGLKSSPLISVSLHLLHNCPSSRQVGWQIFGFLWFQLHLSHQFFLLVDDQYVVSLFSLHCQFTFTFFLSPADEERSGNSWNSFSNDLLFTLECKWYIYKLSQNCTISLLHFDIQQSFTSISMPLMFFDAFTVFARLSSPFCQCEISKVKDADMLPRHMSTFMNEQVTQVQAVYS